MQFIKKHMQSLVTNITLILLAIIVVNNFGYQLKFDYIFLMFSLSLILLKSNFGRVLLNIIVVVSFIYLPISWYYSSPNMTLIASLIETKPQEAIGFIQDYSFSFFLLLVFLASLSIYVLKISKNYSINNRFFFAILIVSIIILFKGYSKVELNDNLYHKISKLRVAPVSFVADSIASFSEYYQEILLRNKLSAIPSSWAISETNNDDGEVKILVIGESVRRDFMNIYGFPLLNTPFSSKQNGVFWTNFISPGTNTASSLKHLLSLNKGVVPQLNNNIVTLAQEGGYDVSWLSNQGRLGIADTYISSIAAYSDYEYFSRKGAYDDIAISDRDLLVEFEQIIQVQSTKNRLIVLHLMDAHPPSCRSVDKLNFEYISEKLSCYVQKIYNTDKLLQDIVKITKSETDNYSLLYFSDHGLVATDNGTNLKHGTEQEAHKIPLFIIGSKYKQREYKEAVKNGYQFIFGISEWLGITVKQNISDFSLFDNKKVDPKVIRGTQIIKLNNIDSDGFNASSIHE